MRAMVCLGRPTLGLGVFVVVALLCAGTARAGTMTFEEAAQGDVGSFYSSSLGVSFSMPFEFSARGAHTGVRAGLASSFIGCEIGITSLRADFKEPHGAVRFFIQGLATSLPESFTAIAYAADGTPFAVAHVAAPTDSWAEIRFDESTSGGP